MRLHTLRAKAFGPFGDSITVDFDTLGADGLFLLHGQTGAGKTSILDAVAFALYGTVPGSRRESKRLLSDHAAAGAVPEVALEATLGGRRLRIVRSPEYRRPKKSGTGTTKQNARVSLTWLDGQGQNLTRLDEVGLEVERLLGMRADQFFQVVLLPQGDFARFLRARTDERGALLERLFDTARFAGIETWFADQRRAGALRLAERSASIDTLAAQIATAAGVPLCADDDPTDWADGLLAEARVMRTDSESERDRAAAALAASTVQLDRARRVREVRLRGEAARRSLKTWAESVDRRTLLAGERDRARRAVPVTEHVQVAARSGDRLQAARRAEQSAHLDLDMFCAQADAPIEGAEQGWADLRAHLDRVLEELERADSVRSGIAAGQAELALQSTLAETVDRRLAEIPAALSAIEAQLATATTVAASAGEHQHRLDRAQEAAAAAARYSELTSELESANAHRMRAQEQRLTVREAWLDIRSARLDGMAAELASALVDGEACGVCGSIEHPQPAAVVGRRVDAADEDAAGALVEQAEAELDRCVQHCTTLRTALADTVARGGDRLAAVIEAELAQCRAAVDAALGAAQLLTDLGCERDAIAGDATTLRVQREELTASIAALRERLSAAQLRSEELKTIIGDSHLAEVQQRRQALDCAIDAASVLRDARQEVRSVETVHREHLSTLDEVVAAAGFSNADEAIEAARERAAIEAIEAELAAADRDHAVATSVLTDPEVGAALDTPEVDLAPLDESVREATARHSAAIAAAAEASRRVVDLQDLTAALWSAVDRLRPVIARQRELEGLAEVMAGRGANDKGMSLRSYVLAARLEDVAAAASERFRRMSGGRFDFVYTDEPGPRNTRGGLGLAIRDDYTGVVRAAGTLSGGESFCASLSLALGLADVIAAESGGVRLDTMFIDEGFGSLDAESLDSVMEVLDDLRAGGRTVGIVSHVDEIRDRVPSRLHVLRGRSGSTVRMHALV